MPASSPNTSVSKRLPLGELLVQMGHITQAELEAALAYKQENGIKLGQALVGLHLVSQSDLAHALHSQGSIHCVHLTPEMVDLHVALELGPERSRQFQAVAFNKIAGIVSVALEDPSETYHIDAISLAMDAPVFAVHAEPDSIQECIAHVFGRESAPAAPAPAAVAARPTTSVELAGEQETSASSLDGAASSFVRGLLEEAVERGASDVHLEPRRDGLYVRFRIEGALCPRTVLPREWCQPVLARIKLLSCLDVGERRLPQEGKTQTEVRGKRVDFRVTTAPTLHGEGAVLHLLDCGRRLIDLDGLPLDARQREDLEQMTTGGSGLVLVAGPAGQGRTSTLYALVQRIDPGLKKIITIEDPVEDTLEGAVQMHVNARIGLSFERALRSALHQDPDVLLIGEIEAGETAALALQAALSGRLVLSTLHAPGAAQAITRLTDMGLEPYLLADALRGIVAQRLVRRLCRGCARPAQPAPELLARLDLAHDGARYNEPGGCEACAGTGYQGRIALYEVLRADDALWDAIRGQQPAHLLRERARARGWTTLRMDGIAKARAGHTTLEEVYAATARG